jgi:hypothetical protein
MNNIPRPVENELRIELAARANPLVLAIATLPVAIAANIALILSATPVEPIILPILILVGCTIIPLAIVALQHICGGELILNRDGIIVSRLASKQFFARRAIRKIEVTPATGTFSDNPFSDHDSRVGIGLRLDPASGGNPDQKSADIILMADTAIRTAAMLQVVDKIERFRSRTLRPAAPTPQPRRARQSKQRKEFRQQPDLSSVA